jgi:hypothetical protein
MNLAKIHLQFLPTNFLCVFILTLDRKRISGRLGPISEGRQNTRVLLHAPALEKAAVLSLLLRTK